MNAITGKSGKVYVANVTQQNQIINFSTPESRKPLSFTIPMGQQRMIGDFSSPEIDAMVNQLGRYGLAELGQESKKEKLAYVFSVGSPVPAATMARLIDQNKGILRKEGAERRVAAAVAAHNLMNNENTPMNDVVVDVEEVESGTLEGSEKIGAGVRISSEAAASSGKKSGGKGKRN